MSTATTPRRNRRSVKPVDSLPGQEVLPLGAGAIDDSQLMSISQRLKERAIGCRLSRSQMSRSKSLDKDHAAEAAAALGAKNKRVSASKQTINTDHPAVKKVNALFNRIDSYWKANSLPMASAVEGDSVEPGLRLMRQDRVQEFRQQFKVYQAELAEAVKELNKAMPEIKALAREDLGERLYREADYPSDVAPLYAIHYSFVSVEPPSYLAQLDKEGYDEECAKVALQLKDTVQLAQALFMEEFRGELDHVCGLLHGVRESTATKGGKIVDIKGESELGWLVSIETEPEGKLFVQKVPPEFELSVAKDDVIKSGQKLGASITGKVKIFKDANIRKLIESVSYFNQLGSLMGCSAEVEQLVKQTETILKRGVGKGVEGKEVTLTPELTTKIVESVKKPGQFRDEVSRSFRKLRKTLEDNMVARPKRKLISLTPDA